MGEDIWKNFRAAVDLLEKAVPGMELIDDEFPEAPFHWRWRGCDVYLYKTDGKLAVNIVTPQVYATSIHEPVTVAFDVAREELAKQLIELAEKLREDPCSNKIK